MPPLPPETRLLVMAVTDVVMREVLGPEHPSASATFSEARPLQALSAVLCADAPASSSATRRVGDLGFGTRTVHDDVEVAFPAQPRPGGRLRGFADFGDLRQLCLEGVTS